MLIEAPTDRAVHWMSPNDADESLIMSIGPKSKLAHHSVTMMALCDGGVRSLSDDAPAASRRALISIAGHDKVEADF